MSAHDYLQMISDSINSERYQWRQRRTRYLYRGYATSTEYLGLWAGQLRSFFSSSKLKPRNIAGQTDTDLFALTASDANHADSDTSGNV